VRLVEKSTTLTTEHLIYNRVTKTAFYDKGGTIVNADNTLTSKKGYYNTDSKIFYFRKDVVLVNPDSETYSDTLIYNTINETAYFEGPTVIRGKESTIYCEKGFYDTQNDFSKLTKRPFISGSEQTITADSILYDNALSSGKAFGSIEILDTLHKVIITGKYGEMWDKKGSSFITDSVIAVSYDEADSMFIHSDTMWMYFDKKRNAKKLLAYYGVRFFRTQMQGKCDSLVYTMTDSTIRFHKEPVLWSEKNQLTADSISIFVAGNRVDSLEMYNTAFIVSRDSTDTYNQIRGRNMVGYFRDNELVKISVDGNAQTVYYIREEDGYLIGINLSESSTMDIRLVNSELNAISYKEKAVEKMYPEKDYPVDQKTLKGFSWEEALRPVDKYDIFRKELPVAVEGDEKE
jgi:lipopolysaccharide export system protein LptA